MTIIGLTGGIAGGKSTLARMLEKKGAVVIDADQIAKEETRAGKPAYEAIVNQFGKSILNGHGEIDRKELGRIVFPDPSKLRLLNALTHGPIIERIKRLVMQAEQNDKERIIIIEVPLLIESGLGHEADKIVVVSASEDTRIRRLIARGLSKKEAVERLESQISDRKRRQFSDYIIENNGTLDELETKAEQLWRSLVAQPG